MQRRKAEPSFAASEEGKNGKDAHLPASGLKGQQSSLAIYLPVRSHIHHEMPFFNPQPKGDMLGKKN